MNINSKRSPQFVAWLGAICLVVAVGIVLAAIWQGWASMPSWAAANAWTSRWWPIVCAILVSAGVTLLARRSVNLPRSKMEVSTEVRPLSSRAIGATGLVVALTIFAIIFSLLLTFGQDERNALEAVKAGGTYVVAVGGAVALWLAARRQRSTEATLQEQMRAAQSTEWDATERRITDLYANAVNQLGSEKAAVRLGGLYALERLAENYEAHQHVVLEVLCAYLRMPMPDSSDGLPTAEKENETQAHNEQLQPQESVVRRAAAAILARHRIKGIQGHFWKAEKYLPKEGLNLSGGYLRGAPFAETDFIAANFTGAKLRGAKFRNARLKSAKFIGADLSDADLAGADLSGTDLTNAAMSGAIVTKAHWDSGTKWPDHAREYIDQIQHSILESPAGRFKMPNIARIP